MEKSSFSTLLSASHSLNHYLPWLHNVFFDETPNVLIHMNDPANGQLIDPDCFEYALDNTRFRLNIVRNNRKVLRYLEEHHINTELYGEIVLHYTPLSKPQLESLSAVVLRLFFGCSARYLDETWYYQGHIQNSPGQSTDHWLDHSFPSGVFPRRSCGRV